MGNIFGSNASNYQLAGSLVSGGGTVASLLGATALMNPIGIGLAGGLAATGGILSLLGKNSQNKDNNDAINKAINNTISNRNKMINLGRREKNDALETAKSAYRSGDYQLGRTTQARINSNVDQYTSQARINAANAIGELKSQKDANKVTALDVGKVAVQTAGAMYGAQKAIDAAEKAKLAKEALTKTNVIETTVKTSPTVAPSIINKYKNSLTFNPNTADLVIPSQKNTFGIGYNPEWR